MTMDGEPAGRLISLNVGLPQDVAWQGRTVRTAVWKRPVEGPRRARRLNIDGDGQGDLGGHGGEQRAVFLYQLDSYGHWARELGRDDLEHGIFGENLTVEGLPDDEVCIGDRYRIGGAVLEVTQPRVTCYRVGIRVGDPRIPALLVSHRRPGFYLRVLEEGDVQAGDEIVKLASGPEGMTRRRGGRPAVPPRPPARAAAAGAADPGPEPRLAGVVPGAARGRGRRQRRPGRDGPAAGLAGLPRPARSSPSTARATTILSIGLADPGGAPVPAALPGQYLTLRVPAGPEGRPLLRTYSLSGPPGAERYRVSVKREEDGAASGYLHERLRVGDRLDVAAPRGTFTLRPGDGPVLLISAGVGATPVLAMLHELAAERSGREVWWLHGARSGRDEPFAAEARALVDALPDARAHVCFSRPGRGDRDGRDFQTAGRLSAAVLDALDPPADADAYVCGPAAFMDEISAALAARGVPGSRDPHRAVRAGALPDSGDRGRARPPPSPARAARGGRAAGRVRAQ